MSAPNCAANRNTPDAPSGTKAPVSDIRGGRFCVLRVKAVTPDLFRGPTGRAG
jgi:hypothetical protein